MARTELAITGVCFQELQAPGMMRLMRATPRPFHQEISDWFAKENSTDVLQGERCKVGGNLPPINWGHWWGLDCGPFILLPSHATLEFAVF